MKSGWVKANVEETCRRARWRSELSPPPDASHDVRMGRVAGFIRRVNISSSLFIMAERQNDWIIDDSEEEEQLCAAELDPVPPGAHHLRLASCQGFTDVAFIGCRGWCL